jgi:hypothetical protein
MAPAGFINIGAVYGMLIFGGSFLVMAQESSKVENFLGVKWGNVY